MPGMDIAKTAILILRKLQSKILTCTLFVFQIYQITNSNISSFRPSDNNGASGVYNNYDAMTMTPTE